MPLLIWLRNFGGKVELDTFVPSSAETGIPLLNVLARLNSRDMATFLDQ
jgi:hypothetical protein